MAQMPTIQITVLDNKTHQALLKWCDIATSVMLRADDLSRRDRIALTIALKDLKDAVLEMEKSIQERLDA